MPSTIRIKRSSVAGKRPTTSDISTGELAINTKDFKLFSSNGTAVFELGNAGALANTNARINLINTNLTGTNTALRTLIATKANDVGAANRIPYRNSSNVLTSSSGLQYDGVSIKVSGNLESTYQNGDEGGEFFLAKPLTNSTITNGVTIDVFRNQLRIFENGGSNRGAYIDITAASGGVGSNLLAGGSSGATWAALTSTNTALRTLINDRLQVANAAATYQTRAIERAALANTNASIATQATRITLVNTNLTGTNTALRTLINARMQVSNVNTLIATRMQVSNVNTLVAARATWAGLTGTNTALRTLISDRLQVANAVATYQTRAVERAALANTNASIATQATRITLVNTNLLATNTAIRALDNQKLSVANAAATYQTRAIERAALANTNASIATQATRVTLVNTNLTGTNTALRTLINDRLQVANAATLYTTKINPATSGLLAHTGRLTISTNLYVAGNTILGNPATVTDRTIINGVTIANGQLTVTGNVSVSGVSSLSNITVAQGTQAYFYHASQTDVNDGRIGAGTFDTGLNIVGVQTAAATGRIVRLYGSVVTNTDYRGPIYYDSNNTAYYLDPAGTSVLNTLNPYTVATGSGQFTTALNIAPSTHATSRRAALSLDDWLVLQDSNGNGTKNFSIYSSVAASNRFNIDTSGNVDAAVSYRAPFFYSSSDTNAYWSAGAMVMRSASPTIYFRDTDHNSAMIHVNSNLFYILRGGNDSTSWTQVNSVWPLQINLTNNNADFGGIVAATTDVRAPIFYDSNNTAFYLDPASNSVLNNVYLDGTVYMRGTEASQTLTDAATIAWDTNSGRIATVTIGASRTMGAPTNAKVGTYVLYVIQGGTGSYNITWNSVFKWPGGVAPTLSTAVGRRDIFTFIYDGTNFYGSYINDVR